MPKFNASALFEKMEQDASSAVRERTDSTRPKHDDEMRCNCVGKTEQDASSSRSDEGAYIDVRDRTATTKYAADSPF